jgi:hypothetical protein
MRPVLATILLMTGLPLQAAEIYCNAQGRECNDRPTPTANIARSLGARPAGSATASGATTSAASTASATAGTGQGAESMAPPEGVRSDPVAEQQRQDAAVAAASKAMQKDLSDKRSEQCRRAQEYYKQAIEATAIFRTDKDGKKQLLNEADANQNRLQARLEVERTCGHGG